ncbi:DUF3718 domain-containing protein [Gallaecimonas kandeliae]|uniref:DUF3718 domain-containing protein n=1 Tax=Gallaecimonas kandeliae TaxID=3029055 RepID=UPI0026473B20|nr:DUF3718 domain-containing protein [Gallaecimonas kandeliae]WKE66412.1 DUF3718 domain-containing protein [Gallaecimonas kandeliae]
MTRVSIATVALLLAAALPSQATTYKAGDNSEATRICMSTLSNSPARVLMAARGSGLGYNFIANYISCNNMPISHFALMVGSDKVAFQLQRRFHQRTRVEIRDLGYQPKKDGTILVAGSF